MKTSQIPLLIVVLATCIGLNLRAQVEEPAMEEELAPQAEELPAETVNAEPESALDPEPVEPVEGLQDEELEGNRRKEGVGSILMYEGFNYNGGAEAGAEGGFGESGFFPTEPPAIERGETTTPAPQPVRNPFNRREDRGNRSSQSDTPRVSFGANNGDQPATSGDGEIRLNFRGVPLEMVLDYLSEAAGFIIIPETDISGKVDVWSNQPLTREEAVDVLNSVLNKNGYAAIRNGRSLTIVSRDEARRRDNPVVSGANPDIIPKTDQIVTQIIPVRYINAAALTTDLQPLLPSNATLTANEAGNALVLTDTQSNVRRMVEIVAALDTSVASISSVRVFPLRYADAKELATIIKEVFEAPGASNNQDGRNRFQNFFRGPGGRGGGDDSPTATGGRAGATRVTAVADERSNSLVVSAPSELIPTIEELVESVDTNIEDITDLRVFHLQYADPVETAELLTSLFQDESESNNNNNRQVRFGGRGRPNINNAATEQSDRLKKQTRVVAVADQRTGSVVVSAARTMMPQIEEMVTQLDSDPARKQKVFVFSVENTDPQAVQAVLENLFESPAGRNASNNRNNNNALGNQLNTRATQQQNQQRGTTGNTLGGGAFGTDAGR